MKLSKVMVPINCIVLSEGVLTGILLSLRVLILDDETMNSSKIFQIDKIGDETPEIMS